MKSNESTYAVIFVTKAHGFNHINTRLNRATNDDLVNVKGGDLPFSSFSDHHSNICFNIQYNLDRVDEGYGYSPVIHDVYNLNLDAAEQVLKILRKVTKGYNKRLEESSNHGAIPALIAFLEAANVKRVFIRYYDTVGFDNLSMTDAIYQLTKIDEGFKR